MEKKYGESETEGEEMQRKMRQMEKKDGESGIEGEEKTDGEERQRKMRQKERVRQMEK